MRTQRQAEKKHVAEPSGVRNGDPNVTGCDYSAVEEGVAAQASPVGHTRGRVSKADGHKRRELRVAQSL